MEREPCDTLVANAPGCRKGHYSAPEGIRLTGEGDRLKAGGSRRMAQAVEGEYR